MLVVKGFLHIAVWAFLVYFCVTKLQVCDGSATCFSHIRDPKRLSKSLTRDALVTAANALVSSRLDYCNSLFRSLSSYNMRKLQAVQNSLARVVTKTTRYTHISLVRKKLHWLPIEYRCVFKTAHDFW